MPHPDCKLSIFHLNRPRRADCRARPLARQDFTICSSTSRRLACLIRNRIAGDNLRDNLRDIRSLGMISAIAWVQLRAAKLPYEYTSTKGSPAMSTVQSASIDIFPNGTDGVAAMNQSAEVAELQSRQEMLTCTLAAQEKIETIRSEYAILRRLVHRIRELKADESTVAISKDTSSTTCFGRRKASKVWLLHWFASWNKPLSSVDGGQ